MEDTFKKYNIEYIYDNDVLLVKASIIGKFIGMTNVRPSIKNYTKTEKCIRNVKTLGGNQDIWFLTINGVNRPLIF